MDMKRKKYLPIHFVYCRGRNVVREKKKELSLLLNSFIFNSRGDWIRTSDHTPPPGAYFMIYVFCICLIFSMVFIDNQLFNFYKFSSVLMVFAQNVVDLL